MIYRRFVKRILDIFLSGAALIVLCPFILAIVLVIRADSPGRAIFRQNRAGFKKKNFEIYKFRTMYVDAPDNVAANDFSNSDEYITRVGCFLRRTSLDELPQLYNILKGEMSFVGPRPLVWAETEVIETRDRLGVYEAVPGLTGWAQIHGRDKLSGSLKCKFDAEYVNNLSFFFDVKCMWKTVFGGTRSSE